MNSRASGRRHMGDLLRWNPNSYVSFDLLVEVLLRQIRSTPLAGA